MVQSVPHAEEPCCLTRAEAPAPTGLPCRAESRTIPETELPAPTLTPQCTLASPAPWPRGQHIHAGPRTGCPAEPGGQPGSKRCCRVTLFGNCGHTSLPGERSIKPLCPCGPECRGASGRDPAPPAQGCWAACPGRENAASPGVAAPWGPLAPATASPAEQRLWAHGPTLPGALGWRGGRSPPRRRRGGRPPSLGGLGDSLDSLGSSRNRWVARHSFLVVCGKGALWPAWQLWGLRLLARLLAQMVLEVLCEQS